MVRLRVQSGGAADNVGLKGVSASAKPKNIRPHCCLDSARCAWQRSSCRLEDFLLGRVAIENNAPQGLPSPAVPPEELTQLERTSARL